MSNITLPRAAEQALESLEGELPGWRTPAQERAIVALRAALDAALKEPEPEQKPEPVAFWHRDKGFYWAKPTEIHMDTITVVPPLALYAAPPQPDAKREPATHEQVFAAYSASYRRYWTQYQAGWHEAERFHGITKEDK